MAIDYQKTGRAISACRQAMGLNQQGLAALMNVTHQAVSKWENGAALPDTATLLALSKLFDVTMEELLLGEVKDRRAAAQADAAQADERKVEDVAETLQAEIDRDMAEAFAALPAQEAQAEEAPGFDVLEAESDEEEEAGEEEADDAGQAQEAGTGGALSREAFSRVVGMLPFVSSAMADRLFAQLAAQGGKLAIAQLTQVAPFVSRKAIDDYVNRRIEAGLDQEETQTVLRALAPFLRSQTVDQLVDGHFGAIDGKLAQALMPFVSTRTADVLVQRILEGQATEQRADTRAMRRPDTPARPARRGDDGAKDERAEGLDRRAEMRWRIACKAVEAGNAEWIEEHAGELTEEQQERLAEQAMENGDDEVLEAVLSGAKRGVVGRVLEKAMEEENWEKIERISEYL